MELQQYRQMACDPDTYFLQVDGHWYFYDDSTGTHYSLPTTQE